MILPLHLVLARSQHSHLIPQPRDLRVCVVDHFVEFPGQHVVFLGERFGHVFLIHCFLRHLVVPEGEAARADLHDRAGREAGKEGGFVIIAGVEDGDDGVVGGGEEGVACWAAAGVVRRWVGEMEGFCTELAEDVTVDRSVMPCCAGWASDLQVVTTARVSMGERQRRLLQRRV